MQPYAPYAWLLKINIFSLKFAYGILNCIDDNLSSTVSVAGNSKRLALQMYSSNRNGIDLWNDLPMLKSRVRACVRVSGCVRARPTCTGIDHGVGSADLEESCTYVPLDSQNHGWSSARKHNIYV